MLEYMLAKVRHEELIREAEKERMLREARQLKVCTVPTLSESKLRRRERRQ